MASQLRESLVAEKQDGDDTASVHSDQDFVSSDEDDLFAPETADRRLLEEPEEDASLIGRSPYESTRKQLGNILTKGQRRAVRRGRQLKELAQGSGNAELMYEMEGGYKDTSSRASMESLILEEQFQGTTRSWFRIILLLPATILIVFLFFAAYRASHKTVLLPYSNGTHTFGATTILISLDGFRADFLQRDLTPAMNAFVSSGASPQYMLPSFPSLTFPNHYTLVTGLYPENHGIVSNQFWDPEMKEEFYYTNTSNSMQSKWWDKAEPLWVTAEKQGLKTAIHMWPGSEAHIGNMDPTYLDKFNESETLDIKVNRILGWLDLPQQQRPQFIGAYVPNVDADGHKYGPNSTEIRNTIVEVDNMLTYLVEGLYSRNLTEIINLVIVSDHGMATTSNERLIQLDDFIDMSLVDHIDGWPLRGLRLKNPEQDLPLMYQQLYTASKTNMFDVYTLETMPERYHFRHNDRIAPLWVIPKAGWAVVEKIDFDVVEAQASGKVYSPAGLHGYDHEHPLMRAIFIARGPAFPHLPNSRLPIFQNIEVYNIICDSLGIKPHSNDGTLRLPLKTEGLHSDTQYSDPMPADPVEEQQTSTSSSATIDTATSTFSFAALDTATKPSKIVPSSTTASTSPTTTPTQPSSVADKSSSTSWWDFLHNQIQKAKDWAKQIADSFKNNQPNSDDKPV